MSPHQGRDDVTDQLIKAALREQGAGTADGRTPSCPDAERLAAFVERRLVPAEVAGLEGHLADCTRCQDTLAALVRALPVLQPLPERRWDLAGWLSSPWRWALMAVATTLVAVWVVSRGPAPTPVQPETTVAEALPSPSGARPEFTEEPAADRPAALTSKSESRPEVAEDERFATAPVARDVPQAGMPAESTTPSGALPQPTAQPPAGMGPVESPRDKGGPAKVADETVRADTAAVAPAPPPPAAPAAAAPIAAEAASPAAQRGETGARLAAEEKAVPTPALPTRRAQETERHALAPRSNEIVAVEGAARWRIGFGGVLFRSVDGITWDRQQTGTTIDLLSGSAPSASVCWVVGREGLVLLTTDGEHWQRVPFPEAVDLVHVEAHDARRASVTTADERRFETTDAGRTWVR